MTGLNGSDFIHLTLAVFGVVKDSTINLNDKMEPKDEINPSTCTVL